ncbi:MAG: aminotransferase [Alteromonadaceae bacterium]|nr:aminotransferase [Alteromonadaceae bacterium]MBH86168.1 aminotransferase [Alteromonadaceae bacterium]
MTLLTDTIRNSIIGERALIPTLFGDKPLVYADYTASGRSLTLIEDYIRNQVMPWYANTHTETSFTGAQSTALREQARRQVRSAVNGTDDDKVIFCGSGATAAIDKLIDVLNLRLPADLNTRYKLEDVIPEPERPVVFIGPYEHHSNELPWRESIADVVRIPLCRNGQLDGSALEKALLRYSDRTLKIGSFSAASNVTGIKTHVDAVTRLLHQHGALAFWDYAAAGPYVGIDMTGSVTAEGDSHKDAVFLSPHKFVGGPGTPGVLIAKRHLFKNRVPAVPGGGTVAYVTPDDHRYTDDIERREEGGTPAIIESIRAGLVFRLQQQVGTDTIEALETDFMRRARERWSAFDNIEILGPDNAPQLSIASLRIKHQGKDLHYGFVVALLNDLFGIQARGGCSCAGPYGHALLNMDMAYSRALDKQVIAGHMILRPGWVRLNFNYFIDESTFEYLIRAVELVAEHGWRLLPYYAFDTQANVWRYQGSETPLITQWQDIDFEEMDKRSPGAPATADKTLPDYLAIAEKTLTDTRDQATVYSLELPEEAEALRWFALPQQAARAF